MCDVDFADEITDDCLLMKVMREVKKTDPVSSRLMLRQAYENTFGLHNYITQAISEQSITDPSLKRPLSIVGMLSGEDYGNTSKLYELIRLYSDAKVFDYYHLNLMDFLDLPHDICDMLVNDCHSRIRKDNAKTDTLIGSLNTDK